MDIEQEDFQSNLHNTGILADDRSIRILIESSGITVCDLETGPRSGSDKSFLVDVDERTRVGVSALLSLAAGSEQDPERQSEGSSHSTNMANPSMVPSIDSSGHGSTGVVAPGRYVTNSTTSHPLISTLNLAAWKLSGTESDQRVFQNKLQRFCSRAVDQELISSMNQPGRPGLAGVLRGFAIQFQHL